MQLPTLVKSSTSEAHFMRKTTKKHEKTKQTISHYAVCVIFIASHQNKLSVARMHPASPLLHMLDFSLERCKKECCCAYEPTRFHKYLNGEMRACSGQCLTLCEIEIN
jgi:hypothetical protein